MAEKTNATGDQNMSWLHLFKTPKMRKITIFMSITWWVRKVKTFWKENSSFFFLSDARCLVAGLFDANIRNVANLDYSIYVTFTISAALELPADLLSIWGIDKFGRRWSLGISLFISAVTSFTSAILTGFLSLTFYLYIIHPSATSIRELFPYL